MKKKQVNFKYNEDKILQQMKEYIESTYDQHYVGENNIQVIDVWKAMGIEKENCSGNAIKYNMRFGKKEGKNKKDILKLLHYVILLYNFEFEQDD